MQRCVISTEHAPGAIGPYSQAIQAEGKFLFLSGQIPLTLQGDILTGDVGEQTAQVMANLEAVLAAAGLTFANVVKTTVLLSSMDHFVTVNAIYGSHFIENPPARATYAVAGLPRGVDIEIEAIAVF